MIEIPGDDPNTDDPHGTSSPMTRRASVLRLASLLLSLRAPRLFAATPGHQPGGAAPWNPDMEVAISFRIGDPRSVAGRRPYVAVYVETPDGDPVRTIALWSQGQNAWLRQLRHWYRTEVARRRADGGNLIQTVSSPTRQPGSYTVVWDGRDNAGEYVSLGRYALFIETIRQNAGNHMVREELTFGTEPFEKQIEPYASIADIAMEFRPRR